ncbi:MAG: hypothetical protein HOW73_30415 [Polyangiaceae bacterium]|nr:hypothetical protein [Polyangiaceae bacterium]
MRTSSIAVALVVCLGCDEVSTDGTSGVGGSGGEAEGGHAIDDPFEGATPLDVAVESGPTFVDLDGPAVVDETDDWELRFEGVDIHTNGGASGDGQSKAFGPLSAETFLTDSVPSDLPFMIVDEPGGAFVDWYAYDGTAHALYSRYHVIGVRRGDELFKIQILGYYGEEEGAPVSALIQARSARVTPEEVGSTTHWENIDATAGGPSPTEDDPSGCIVLGTGERIDLTPSEAAASTEWDLCFRRDGIIVNGGQGGPGGVEAVNLQAAGLDGETLEEVAERTAESELALFDAVDYAALTAPGLAWRGDGVVSAFTGGWLTIGDEIAVVEGTWVVAGKDGVTPFFVTFESVTGASPSAAGTIHLYVKKVGGTLP